MIALYLGRTFSRRLRPRQINFFSSITSARMESNTTDGVKWLWELNEDQKAFHSAHLRGTRIGTFIVTFNTSKLLTLDDFLVTFEHIYRKVPHVRIDIRKRGDSLWFCQPASLKLSIKVMDEDCDLKKEILDIVQTGILCPEIALSGSRIAFCKEDAVCAIPDVKATHPYQYRLLHTGHHAMMDGLGATLMINFFVDILNKVAKGIPVDDKQYVSFYEEKEIPLIIDHLKAKLKNDQEFSKAVKDTLPLPESVPLFFKVFPRPNTAELDTKYIVKVLESDALDKLMSRSREVGVSFNSAIVSAINTAIVELAREKGIIVDSYEISPLVIVSLRRYMKQSSEFFMGPSGSFLSFKSVMDENARKFFWDYCKVVDRNIKAHLKEGLPLHQKAYQSLNFNGQPPSLIYDYGLTNLGNLGDVSPSDSDSLIKFSHISSINLVHDSIHSNLHELVRFQGRLFYTLTYPTNCLSDETAKIFIEKIFSVIERVTKDSISKL